jgi:hypothetical protein
MTRRYSCQFLYGLFTVVRLFKSRWYRYRSMYTLSRRMQPVVTLSLLRFLCIYGFTRLEASFFPFRPIFHILSLPGAAHRA